MNLPRASIVTEYFARESLVLEAHDLPCVAERGGSTEKKVFNPGFTIIYPDSLARLIGETRAKFYPLKDILKLVKLCLRPVSNCLRSIVDRAKGRIRVDF